jgi:glutathione S-transferase
LGSIEVIQQLLPEEEGFAIGKWSIADAAVIPFLARAEVLLKNDIGKYEVGKGKAVWAKLETDPKYGCEGQG